MLRSPCTVVLLTAVQGGCWHKPAKYFKTAKVLVSPPYSFSSGGPHQLKNYFRKYEKRKKKYLKNMDLHISCKMHLQNSLLVALSAACSVCVMFGDSLCSSDRL